MLSRLPTTSLLGRTIFQLINSGSCQYSTNTSTATKTTTTASATATATSTAKKEYAGRLASTHAYSSLETPVSKLYKGDVLLEGIKHDGTSLRWYKHVGYSYDAEKGGYLPLLDNRAMKTPMGTQFVVPNRELAIAIAAEWWCQEKYIKPSRLPLTATAATCLDLNAKEREKSINELIGHLATDPVCNRDPEESKLKTLQNESYDNILSWASEYYGIPFYLSFGLDISKHPPALLKIIKEHLASLSNWQLLCLQLITSSTKSFLVTLALYYGHVRLDNLYKVVALEEEYQSDIWGKIPFGHDLAEMETCNEIAPALFVLRSIPPIPLPKSASTTSAAKAPKAAPKSVTSTPKK
ncbi:hypothetical protein SAMD00019534_096600 [Acytostelium subglobosum LB1]|uniref:hypothetical protein n=1 Tax=Acytostelium subglobosum LB1 TaxID=1410327 RepID=UPI000644DE36|nr:hypothetical protein SAMD00019534_096600 [Acytostelium subglobosum LB1]GAM26485.1 hypothetical protein SAMD00019534_096600 [Acytostelium subglobosum LB1]|eukprot:XP_012750581.1 hypothetical protein SAMD00019534_096600 [Acytostelium subglobosum LB1]